MYKILQTKLVFQESSKHFQYKYFVDRLANPSEDMQTQPSFTIKMMWENISKVPSALFIDQ